MKYIFFLIIVLIISCTLTIPEYDWQIPIEINTIQEALDYVDSFQFEEKQGVFTPEEFYYQGFGDCEDFSLMLQFILETELNIKADIIGGTYNGVPHAWVEVDGIIHESTLGRINESPLYEPLYRYEYPYSVIMIERLGGFLKDDKYRY